MRQTESWPLDEVYILILSTYNHVTSLYGKRDFSDAIKFKTLDGDIILDYYPGGPDVITRVFIRGRQRQIWREKM